MRRLQFLPLFSILILAACGGQNQDNSGTSNDVCPSSPSAPVKSEPALCTNILSPSSPVTITGSAVYQRRQFVSQGLGSVDSTTYPIRYAEIAVLDASGNQVQCGETDASGDFSLQIPTGSEELTIEVRSRGSNSNINASILDNHTNVMYYKINQNFTPNSSKSIGTLTAAATGTLEGGAFNIFDKIVDTTQYLKTNTNNCSATFSDCNEFTTATSVDVYWTPGCNPGLYYGAGPVSFYISGTSRMYILGGSDGDVDSSDTDHFDDTIIIHEFGHFLEDQYSNSDSPGGSHDANTIIDPRLAWSEGWATFLAMAVTGESVYRDTYGNTDGNSFGYGFPLYNAENDSPKRDPSSSSYTFNQGEGNFREFAIVRALLDAVDTSNEGSNDTVNINFNELWTIFNGTNSFKHYSGSSGYYFRSVGLFAELHAALTGATDISNELTANKIDANRSDYAAPLSASSCSNITISPAHGNSKIEDGTFANSNLFASNDFYYFYHTGGNLDIDLAYTTSGGDLDLYLYSEDYIYGSSSKLVAFSNSESDGGTEEINQSVDAGPYIINVMAYTGSSGGSPNLSSSSYNLSIGGSQVCP